MRVAADVAGLKAHQLHQHPQPFQTLGGGADTVNEGKVFNLASGVDTSVLDVVETIFDILEVPVRVHHDEPRPGDVRKHRGAASAAKEGFGFSPTTSLHDGLAVTVDWYRAHLAKGS